MRKVLSRRHRRIHVFAVVALTLGVAAATSVSPAAAARKPAKVSAVQLAFCNPLNAGSADTFSSYNRLLPAFSGRDADRQIR